LNSVVGYSLGAFADVREIVDLDLAGVDVADLGIVLDVDVQITRLKSSVQKSSISEDNIYDAVNLEETKHAKVVIAAESSVHYLQHVLSGGGVTNAFSSSLKTNSNENGGRVEETVSCQLVTARIIQSDVVGMGEVAVLPINSQYFLH